MYPGKSPPTSFGKAAGVRGSGVGGFHLRGHDAPPRLSVPRLSSATTLAGAETTLVVEGLLGERIDARYALHAPGDQIVQVDELHLHLVRGAVEVPLHLGLPEPEVGQAEYLHDVERR